MGACAVEMRGAVEEADYCTLADAHLVAPGLKIMSLAGLKDSYRTNDCHVLDGRLFGILSSVSLI